MNHDQFESIMTRVRNILPLQNPLTSFVHNNLLMAWENHEFWEGVGKAAVHYEADFPKPVEFYQAEAAKGRIVDVSLLTSLRREWDATSAWAPAEQGDASEVERTLLVLLKRARRHAADPLCEGVPPGATAFGAEVRELLHWGPPRRDGKGPYPSVFREWFCTLLETYLDQGLAPWNNPFRSDGILAYASATLGARFASSGGWAKKLQTAIASLDSVRPLEKMAVSFPGDAASWEVHLLTVAFVFKGWLGMVNKAEMDPDQFPVCGVPSRLEEALIILVLAFPLFSNESFGSPAASPAEEPERVYLSDEVMLEKLNTLRASEGAGPLASDCLGELVRALNSLDRLKTARVWHHAYEDSLYRTAIGALGGGPTAVARVAAGSESYQTLLCMDDREESFRRHLEEISPTTETYGVLGNFNLDIKYLGLGNPKPRMQCPPVVTPRRTLYETWVPSEKSPLITHSITHFPARWEERARAAILLSTGSWVRGFASSVFIGFAALLPLFSRVVFPTFGRRMDDTWRSIAQRLSEGANDTQVVLEREEHPTLGPCGFTLEEQAEQVASVLKPLDIHLKWAPVVLAVAHQATSDNNPFHQAYGCGACSGNSGAANSRAFARMANSDEVRAILREKHRYFIAPDTRFVAAVHDTTRDTFRFFPRYPLSPLQTKILRRAKRQMLIAAARNSFERTQFFDNTGGRIPPSQALDHCRARSESLAEPRPEYGHSRVAVAVFGPRNWTESLCLDRRGFLISYHHEHDTKNADSLRELIHGALPVVANIGLDYFFSSVDSHGFGSGSKLPLNISALVGVVSGSRGDLRVGLAHQMVEIHEPVRPLAIVHARKEALHGIIHEHGRLRRLTQGGWLRVMVFDPSDKQFYALEQGHWAQVAFEKESLTQLYRWGMLNKLDVGGPLSGGNSLMRWSSKPRRRSNRRASATRSADKGRDGVQI